MDVVKGRGVEGPFSAESTVQDLLRQLATDLHTSEEALFLMSEAGDILEQTQLVSGRCFLYRREEVILDDRDLAPIGDWKSFKRYPPGDWYAEGFDYSNYHDFIEPYYAPIPAVEKRLFHCQESAKMLYAVYKMHLDRYRALEYATLSRARAATALLKYSGRYLKSMEAAHENMHIDSLPHTTLAAYKDKVKAWAQRSDLTSTQREVSQFLLKADFGKVYDERKSKLEGKIGKTQNLIGRLRDSIAKTKNTVRARRSTVFTYFEGRSQSEALTREPYLAVTLATARSEYTRFRDLLAKLLGSHASRSTLISIAETLGKGFDVIELEREVSKAQSCVDPLKDLLKGAVDENDRIRLALSMAMDNASLAVSKLKIKLFKRYSKIPKMMTDLEKYQKFLSIPDQLVELSAALEQEKGRTAAQAAAIETSEGRLLDKIRTERELRQQFEETYGSFVFPSLFPPSQSSFPVLARPASSPCATTAFTLAKSKITAEIAALESNLLVLSQELLQSKGQFEQMQRDRLSFIQLQHFCARGPRSKALSRELSGLQMEFLEEASKLMQCL